MTLFDGQKLFRGLREDVAAALGDDDEILDPHAADARQVDARLDGDDVARRPAGVSAVRASRGASWVTSPTPCPRPWPKCSPWPAASMMSRATASISRPSGPGRTASSAVDLRAQRQRVDLGERRRAASPVAHVRVQSEQ